MAYTTWFGDAFENENDEEMSRKYTYDYETVKHIYPDVCKLPEDEVKPMISKIYEGDSEEDFDQISTRIKDYAKEKEQEWQEKYFGGEVEEKFEDYSMGDIFNRVLDRTLGEEGGYENRPYRIDTPTNMGFQQVTLDRFKVQHPDLTQGYPEDVRDLTYEQGKQIARLDYFDKYRIGEIKHQPLQETLFDAFFNHSPKAPALWAQRSINKYTNRYVDEDGIFGSQTINALNNLSDDEIVNVNNGIIDQRQADYERELNTNQNPYYRDYTKGLPSRFNRFRIKHKNNK